MNAGRHSWSYRCSPVADYAFPATLESGSGQPGVRYRGAGTHGDVLGSTLYHTRRECRDESQHGRHECLRHVGCWVGEKCGLESGSGQPGVQNRGGISADGGRQASTYRLTGTTSSKIAGGTVTPLMRRRSRSLGVMPVARKRPCTLPASVTPMRSKVKISCKSTFSSFTPSTSLTERTLRVPSC